MTALGVQHRFWVAPVDSPEQPLQNRNSSGALLVVVGDQQGARGLKQAAGVDAVEWGQLFVARGHQLEALPACEALRNSPVPALVIHQHRPLHDRVHLRRLWVLEHDTRSRHGQDLRLLGLRPGGGGAVPVLPDQLLHHRKGQQVFGLDVADGGDAEARPLVSGELGGVHHLGPRVSPGQNARPHKVGVGWAANQIRRGAHRNILYSTSFQRLEYRRPRLPPRRRLQGLIQALRGLRQGGEHPGGALMGEQ
mmetsp:Transcript_33224/g.86077  ORF Transcript_33224/g.86077 Transcript_33224/m.86077 type:complete len:251 (+) Transcript_33224:188-940(+)